ncbi:MAG: hypothetical protein RML93_11435, partial [Anaerolineales bacterium]|nr:hypothetical protein [Anaerolineales bacterium]MDW8447889.1 hypothetical protein [Anaerolineales bacterium]
MVFSSFVSRALVVCLLIATPLILFQPPPAASAAGTVRYAVPAGHPTNGLNSGTCTSWAAACTLSYALTQATSGDEIWVRTGVYKPTDYIPSGFSGSHRTLSFALRNGVALYGGFKGTETSRHQRNPTVFVTVLSGDIDNNDTTDLNGVTTLINGSNSYHVVTGNNVNNTAALYGFVITGGQANNVFPNNTGGGMQLTNSNPTLTGLTFAGNYASGGGGMSNSNSSPSLVNVIFRNNSANFGGGMDNRDSEP